MAATARAAMLGSTFMVALLVVVGVTATDVLHACLRRLGVADQRGFCVTSAGGANVCPLAQPSYRDACEQRNDAEGRSGCG